LADRFRDIDLSQQPFHMVLGMLERKDPAGFLKPFNKRVSQLYAIPVPGESACHPPADLAALAKAGSIDAQEATDVAHALRLIKLRHAGKTPPVVLITGSLYLAGHVLEQSGLTPA
jgi:dihydrofolate synthase / folylpolyglutamate synthase